MNTYAWPAQITMTRNAVIVTFPDWPDVSASGANAQEAELRATDALSAALLTRMRARADIPTQSDLGPRQTLIAIDAEAAARLDGYLKEHQARRLREMREIQEAYHNRRTAFLTDFRASVDPIERIIERADAGAKEYAAIGVRFCYILNAGGLVVIPAIMEILPDTAIDRSEFLWPAGAFAFGIVLAAITNYLAYISTIKAGESWSHESNARAKECSGSYYPPENQVEHQSEINDERGNHQRKLRRARIYSDIGICTFGGAIVAFLVGVGSAIFGLW